MAKPKEKPTTEPTAYVVRPGFVVHKERQNSRGQILCDTFDGDDPNNNIVELTDAELPKYLHQLEIPAAEKPEAPPTV